MKHLKSVSFCWLICLGTLLGFERPLAAQSCGLTFSPNPGTGTVTIEAYYQLTGSYTSTNDLAYAKDTVKVGNSTVSAGPYLGWCLDFTNGIDNGPENYGMLMYSSCDPNIDAELISLGATYHFTYPSTDTSETAAGWNQLNYLLNHKLAGASFWDIQAAIWDIIGGPLPPNSWWHAQGYSGLTYNTNNVAAMVNAALANAATWQPECGNVIAVVLADTNKDSGGDFPVQITCIEVPFPCPLGCYPSAAAAEAAALAAANGTCGGTPNFTVSTNGQYNPATITVTGTNGCGKSDIALYTATVLQSGPTLAGLPPQTATYSCYSDIPAAPVVTATDACGNSLTVVATSTQSFPEGTNCNGTMTRIWTTTDCADQTATFTQTITVQDNALPVLTTNTIASCYTSLSLADAAAVKATTGTADCGGVVNFTVSDNGQFCPATITVTGTDGCGRISTATYQAKVLNAAPTLIGVPANVNVQCVSQIPAAPAVTAVDSCGATLAVTTNQTQSNPASTCSNVITRTWSATDCLGQITTATQVITQYNNVTPTASKGSMASCFSSLAAADAAAKAATTTGTVGCGGSLTFSVSDNGQYNPATITVTGADSCGNSVTVTYTATILTSQPVLLGVPANVTVQCASQIPVAPVVTATDSLGTLLTVTTNQTQSNPASTCSNVITRTWSATDCAGQTVTGTQVITQYNNVTPTASKGSIASCFNSLAAADAAAKAATTTGTVGCGGSLTFSVSDNGQYNPATITVTGADSCGNSVTVTYTATILTSQPVLLGVPANMTVQCASQIPVAPVVTATNSLGALLSVTTNQTQSNPTSTCSNVITRTWSATDCAGQTVTRTQVITQYNNVTPTASKGSIASCFNSLAAADAAAKAATTTGTVGCGGGLTFSVSDNGQYNPATITVKGIDACGNTVSVTYTATILTAPPTLSGVPANTTVQCVSEIPTAPTVTGKDSSGTALTVTTNQTQSNPTSTCSNVITRTWKATDCAGQTVTGAQVITQYNNVAATVVCPPSVTIVTNFCRVYCTFGPGDWGGSCNGDYRNNNNWWQNWCSQNPCSQCDSTWNNWWSSCGGDHRQNDWWNGFCTNQPGGWCGGWKGGGEKGNWNGGWNNFNAGSQNWVPCGGNNPDTILNNCFSGIYSSGGCQIGQPNSGNCLTFTSAGAAQKCLNLTGACGVLNGSAVNPATCNAGSFCAQVLALKLNCDFGDNCNDTGYIGKCGDLALNCPSSPCNGMKVRDILGLCNCVLGGGACPDGCTVQSLCSLCSNINQCFRGCQVSSWCSTNLCSVYIPPVSLTGTATVTDTCSASYTLTNHDTVTAESCPGTYLVSRLWSVVDACGNSNGCTQLIIVSQTNSASVAGLVVLACSGDTDLSNNEGLAGVTLTLKNSSGVAVATNTTSSSGSYSFSGLALGTYTVTAAAPSGYTLTSANNPLSVTLTACEGQTGVDFSYTGSTPAVKLIKSGPCTATNKQVITYTFAVTNTGNTCETLAVMDPLLEGNATTAMVTSNSVAPGQGFVFTRTFTVAQTNGSLTNSAWAIGTSPSGASATNTNSTVAIIRTKCVTQTICGSFNSQNPGCGYVWCNAHISANPGKKCTLLCQNASITLTCNDGKTYTFPAPDCQINFSPSCTTGNCSFDGSKWTTTLPCAGDDEIFLSGCGIPWQSDFANCKEVCWTGTFCSDTPGISCNWQWSGACYNTDLSNCGTAGVKPCHQTSCGYPNSDHAGTPENCKSACQGGACGGGGGNYTGSWSGASSFTCAN